MRNAAAPPIDRLPGKVVPEIDRLSAGRVPQERRSAASRLGWAFLAAIGLAGVGLFVLTHPLGGGWAAAGAALYVALIARRSDAWLVWLPALVPVVDLAPWTGMIYLTESDALVCATLLAVSVRAMIAPPSFGARGREWRFGPLQGLLVVAMAASYLVSTDWQPLFAQPWDPRLVVGYESPLNGVRLAKGFVLAVLLLPLLGEAFRCEQGRAARSFVLGMLGAVLTVSLAGLWERLAFPGLSDLASEYRITALFWEMNVGGAMLDAWLALTLPFVLWAVLQRGALPRLVGLVLLVALAGYVSFTTFSRGLYLGAVLGIVVTLALHFVRARSQRRSTSADGRTILLAALGMAFLFWLFSGIFETAGYRGLLAAYGLAGVVYLAGPMIVGQPSRVFVAGWGLAAAAALVSFATVAWIPKGAYLAYAASVLLFAALAVGPALGGGRSPVALALACVPWAAVNFVLVGVFWGGTPALLPGLVAAGCLLLPLVAIGFRPDLAWRTDAHRVAWAGLAIGAVAAAVVAFNSYFATQRFATVGQDLADRTAHWSGAASLPVSAREQLLGIGTGQFSARYFWSAPSNMIPGNHQIETEPGNRFLRLGGPRHVLGFGELFRVSQRVARDLKPPFRLALRARTPEGGARVHLEICRKHLLYTHECTGATLRVPGGGDWATLTATVPAGELGGGGRWLPKLTFFSVATQSRGRLLDVDALTLIDATGRELLVNGDFSDGTQRWFFGSDHHHLPWHAKNLWLHYYVEQGWVGVAAFSLLAIAALFRVTLGSGAGHPLAAPLAGGLIAYFTVGAFDSLVDAPRLTLLLYFALFVALGLRTPTTRPAPTGPNPPPARRRMQPAS